MGSFLQKRIQEQAKKEQAEHESPLRHAEGAEEEAAPVESPTAHPPEKRGMSVGGPVTLDTGYVVPSKRRTSPKIAPLRKQLRSKLLAYPDEADHWSRGMHEQEEMLIGRIKTVLQKMGVQLSQQEFEELREPMTSSTSISGSISLTAHWRLEVA